MSEHPLDDDRIEMLTQPLLTAEGFVNEACINELNAAVRNMPESYDRLENNPEWSLPVCTVDIDILGALANSAVQRFGCCPPDLELIIGYARECFRRDVFTDDHWDKTDKFRLADISLCDINRRLWEYIGDLPQFMAWNDSEVHENWIDLSACLHQTCILVRNDRRHFRSFNEGFDRKHGTDMGER